MSYHPERRQSTLLSSHPKTDAQPIDCILVYNPIDDNDDQSIENYKKSSERRKQFEAFLEKEYKLVLERKVGLNDEDDQNFIGDI